MTFPPSWHHGQGQPPGAGDPFGPNPPGWPGLGAAPSFGTPPPQGKPPRDNIQWVIASVAAVLVIALIVGGLLWKRSTSDDTPTAAPPPTSASAPASPTTAPSSSAAARPAPAARPAECEGRTATAGPNTPAGWKPVLSPRGLVYDVPADWEVLKCTMLVGWEKTCPETPDSPFGACPIRTMSGAAELPNPKCSNTSLAVSGVPGAKSTPDPRDAVDLETSSVEDIYTSESGVVPKVALSAPRDITVSGTPAVEVIATVTGIAADDCTYPNALHVMVGTTVAGQEGSVMFVISLPYQGAPDTDTVAKMVGSLRLAG